MPMRILVTNDDGHSAEGLAALESAAAQFGEIFVLAPADQQSYVGHRVTTQAPLTLTQISGHRFHLDGTPADCVRIAHKALGFQPDLVLSGINHGGNLGADFYTSGTVAAAREAALHGIPGIALSQFIRRPNPLKWAVSTRLALRAIEAILASPLEPGVYWNVNFPNPVTDVELVPIVQCERDPNPLDVAFTRDGNQFLYSGQYATRPSLPGRDVETCFQGNIAMTRFTL